MSDKKTVLILIAIVSVVIILIAILIGIYSTPTSGQNNNNTDESDKLYFVTRTAENGYGICKTNGKNVIDSAYSKIARVNDTVYLKDEQNSYMYFLNDGKSVSLGGKESDVYFVYDKGGNLLPYYVLRYGESEQTSIYRIYNDKGVRHASKDFATLNDAYKFLNAKELYEKNATTSTVIGDKYKVLTPLEYLTNEGKRQYIVTQKDVENGLQGIVDETGRVVLEVTYKKISTIPNSTNAVKAETVDKTYIFLVTEKLIEVESGFEFVTSDGYFIQKRGTTVNKIYNITGDVVVDGIYNINTDLTPLNTKSGASYMLVQENKGVYDLYNLTNNKKTEIQYGDVILEYLGKYNSGAKNTAFMYSKNSTYFALDLESIKAYKMTIISEIVSPLDLGVIYTAQ